MAEPTETVTQAGLYRSVDPAQIDRLLGQYEAMATANREKGQKWLQHRDEYRGLRGHLNELSHQATHAALVPMGRKAFMLGHLVHTNEIMVLLGDNWFAERSARQATQICDKRLKQCDDMLVDLTHELDLVEAWLRETKQMSCEARDGQLEIREPYDEAHEARWRQTHRENQKKHRQSQLKETETLEDEDLWRRLDELEIEEELDAHLKAVKERPIADGHPPIVPVYEQDIEVSDGSSDLSESPPLTDEDDSEAESEVGSASGNRRISFAEIPQARTISASDPVVDARQHESLCTIEIKHSDTSHPMAKIDPLANPGVHLTPQDVIKFIRPQERRSSKSILKPFDPASIQVGELNAPIASPAETPLGVSEPFVNPVHETVVEKAPERPTLAPEPPTKRVSKFKQSRMTR